MLQTIESAPFAPHSLKVCKKLPPHRRICVRIWLYPVYTKYSSTAPCGRSKINLDARQKGLTCSQQAGCSLGPSNSRSSSSGQKSSVSRMRVEQKQQMSEFWSSASSSYAAEILANECMSLVMVRCLVIMRSTVECCSFLIDAPQQQNCAADQTDAPQSGHSTVFNLPVRTLLGLAWPGSSEVPCRAPRLKRLNRLRVRLRGIDVSTRGVLTSAMRV